MSRIAQFFRITPRDLAAANQHIQGPGILLTGDVLCVPGLVPYPSCWLLQAAKTLPLGAGAAAYLHLEANGTLAIGIVARLPQPWQFGDFDIYRAETIVPGVEEGPDNQLFATPEEPPTWATNIGFPASLGPTPDTVVQIRPANSETGVSGAVLLTGLLATCCTANDGYQQAAPPPQVPTKRKSTGARRFPRKKWLRRRHR